MNRITNSRQFSQVTRQRKLSYACSKQCNLRHISLTRVQECTQASSEIEHARVIASFHIKGEAKRISAFRCVAKVQKSRAFCAQGGRKEFRHDRMDQYTNAMSIPKELAPLNAKILSDSSMELIALL